MYVIHLAHGMFVLYFSVFSNDC